MICKSIIYFEQAIIDNMLLAKLEHCFMRDNQNQHQDIRNLAVIMMELVEKVIKENEVIEVCNLKYWSSDDVKFLLATISVNFFDELKEVSLVLDLYYDIHFFHFLPASTLD